MADAPAVIHELVEHFRDNYSQYMDSNYNEEQTRAEFIGPFFEALGWDVTNKARNSPLYMDVVFEGTIRSEGNANAPDYTFRVGQKRMFFVEAKKPFVSINYDPDPAHQIRRYSWTAKLPLGIATNFHELAVYDGRVPPKPGDKASYARLIYMKYADYISRWDEIAAVFSKDAVWRGAFDRFAAEKPPKSGTVEVDEQFLKQIEEWRTLLAHNLALRNPALNVRELNYAVQSTIDRIVFLRICEDRGTEEAGRLLGLTRGPNTYRRLLDLYYKADDRYNSGLFHFRQDPTRHESPDDFTPGLSIDDTVLKNVISGLYYPKSPYAFSVIGVDILGNVYEQFLGKVISLTPAHKVDVAEKPEVKKAGGVYYTPAYIVDYIVKNTVGKLCEGKTPRQVEKLRILDPACGSGSFLINAYAWLLNWHLDYYVKDGPDKHKKAVYRISDSEWRLTTREKKRVLLNNIYGVDIDSQAVEVTKLSLLLKVLEGETAETLDSQLTLQRERALPDLSNNIKCGNSLIGTDFDTGGLGEEDVRRINPFDWSAEFPDTMKRGGFDAVIGNPPYIRVRLLKELYPEQVGYLEGHYRCAVHVWDIYLLFMERALQLARTGGRFSFIVPVQTLHQPNCERLREVLLGETRIDVVADLSLLKVFQEAVVKNCILVCEKDGKAGRGIWTLRPAAPEALREKPLSVWPQKLAAENPGHSLKVDLLSPKKALCDKLRSQSVELGDVCYVTFGLRSCARGKGQGGKDRLITRDPLAGDAKPYLEGRDIARYRKVPTGRFIRYEPAQMYSPRSPALFEAEKIISQTMLSKMRLVATYDEEGFYVEQSLLCVIPHGVVTPVASVPAPPLKFILGLLNSKLESFYFRTSVIDYSLGGGLVHATPGSQGRLVLPKGTDADADRMMKLVDRMLDLHKKLDAANVPGDKSAIRRQIDATDREIDKLVYELYGLTEEEIRIVEEGA